MLSAPPPKQHTYPQFFRHFPLIVGSERVDHCVAKSLGSQGNHLREHAGRRASKGTFVPRQNPQGVSTEPALDRASKLGLRAHRFQYRRKQSVQPESLEKRRSPQEKIAAIDLFTCSGRVKDKNLSPLLVLKTCPTSKPKVAAKRRRPSPAGQRAMQAPDRMRCTRGNRWLKARPSHEQRSRSWTSWSYKIFFPNAEQASSTARSAVRLCSSMTGFTSTISKLNNRP